MVRKSCKSDLGQGLNKGAWTPHEDLLLKNYVQIHGGHWSIIPQKAGLLRSGRSCRLRWMNYLRSEVKHDNFSADEEELIIRLHKLLGNRWSLIAGRIPGRTDNQVKNVWYSRLSKKSSKSPSQHCNVLKPGPYKYKIPSLDQNIITTNAQIIPENTMNDNTSTLVFQPLNSSGHDEDKMKRPEIEELTENDLHNLSHSHENILTAIEMYNSFDNSNSVDNIMDQVFWLSSSSMSPINFNSFLASSTHFQGIVGARMASSVQNANFVNHYEENQELSNSNIYIYESLIDSGQREFSYVGNSTLKKKCVGFHEFRRHGECCLESKRRCSSRD